MRAVELEKGVRKLVEDYDRLVANVEPFDAATSARTFVFTAPEFALLDALTELIIPTDEHSPGARAAGVAGYIDRRLAEYDPALPKLREAREQWKSGLRTLDTLSREASGASFLEAAPAAQVALLERLAAKEQDPKTEGERFFGEARGLERSTLGSRIDEVADQCGLDGILEKPIDKLSKGLRQRVGLAQALIHDPEVLIMDEPTAGLDPNQIGQFRELVHQLRGEKTLLVSTHILQEVDAVAERVLLIHRGHLVFDGTIAEVRERGTVEELFRALTQEGASA